MAARIPRAFRLRRRRHDPPAAGGCGGRGLVACVGEGVADDGLVAEWHSDRGVCVSGFMITITKRLIPK